MIVLLEIMFFLTLAHFIYESILAPSWRLGLRIRLLALRDEVLALQRSCPGSLDDEHYVQLQSSIDTMISMLHHYDVVAVAAAELRYRKDPAFRKRVETRVTMLDGCATPRAQSIRRRSIDLIARAMVVNSGMFCASLYPFVLMGLGLSTLHRSLRKFAALSRRELKSVAPERLGVAIN